MATNRSLATLLRALRSNGDAEDVFRCARALPHGKHSLTRRRLLDSATTLLILLANPLNVTLLTAQLLSAPSIWQRTDDLRSTLRVLDIFRTAACRLLRQEESSSTQPGAHPTQRALSREDWATAVIKGADDRSPRWRHLCVLAGLLIGFEGQGQGQIPRSLSQILEIAIVDAANVALQGGGGESECAANSVAMILSHVFDLLSDGEKTNLDSDVLLPILYHASFFSKDGLHSGYFLSTMDSDILQMTHSKFDWSPTSLSYVQCQRTATGPLMACLGSLSRLTAFAVEHVRNRDILTKMVEDLSAFSRSMCVQWRQNKLSEIDLTEEGLYLGDETLRTTLPLLWRTLRSTMFAMVVVLRSLLSRVLGDTRLPSNVTPFMAIQTLRILRNLSFISSRTGSSSFSQYSFVYLGAVDILTQYPVQAEAFLKDIQPAGADTIPQHPLDRYHDLFFLNTAEHFALILTPEVNEALLIGPATSYLGLGSDSRLIDIFEAAHSVMLSVFSVPHNIDLLSKHIHPYVDVLFTVFPSTLSPRQFRMAIKTLIRVTSPPSHIALIDLLLPSTILELVRFRLENAASTLLQPHVRENAAAVQNPFFSEQSTLELALIDALPFLPTEQLEDWLPVVADSLSLVKDPKQSQVCRERFWEVLSNGEMDVDRAALCVTWWCTRGGREAVLVDSGPSQEEAMMSGALVENSKL